MRVLLIAAAVAAVGIAGFAWADGPSAKPKYTGYYLDAGGDCRSFLTGVVVGKPFCQGALQCKAGTSPCFADGQLACVPPAKVDPKNKACLK
jgi:hypothetical protein